VTTKKGVPGAKAQASYSVDSYYGAQQPVQIIPMMSMKQFVTYLQDAARLNGQDSALAKVLQGQTFVPARRRPSGCMRTRTTSRPTGSVRCCVTACSATCRRASRRSMGLRYSLSSNYFNQRGVIPGQGNTRGTAFGAIDHIGTRLRFGPAPLPHARWWRWA